MAGGPGEAPLPGPSNEELVPSRIVYAAWVAGVLGEVCRSPEQEGQEEAEATLSPVTREWDRLAPRPA